MRMMVAVVAVAMVAPAMAQEAPQPVAASKPDPAQKRVCRSDTATGSHFSTKTCHTRAEWARIDAANRRAGPSAGVTGMQNEPFMTR